VRKACHLHVPIVLKSGSFNLLEPSGPEKACNGTALHFTYQQYSIQGVSTCLTCLHTTFIFLASLFFWKLNMFSNTPYYFYHGNILNKCASLHKIFYTSFQGLQIWCYRLFRIRSTVSAVLYIPILWNYKIYAYEIISSDITFEQFFVMIIED
jgi:hypothetical protein